MKILKGMILGSIVAAICCASLSVCIYIGKLEDERLEKIAENGGTTYWGKYIYDETAPQVVHMNEIREKVNNSDNIEMY